MVKAVIFLVVFCLLVQQSYCGSTTILNVAITWKNRGSQTDFTVSSELGNGITTNSAWLGVGLMSTSSTAMSASDVIVCINNEGNFSIQHNYNSNSKSNLMDSGDSELGITNAVVEVVGSSLTCSYTRDNSNSNANYYDLSTNPSAYVIAAYGTLSSGSMKAHSKSNRGKSSSSLDLSSKGSSAIPKYGPMTLIILALIIHNIVKVF